MEKLVILWTAAVCCAWMFGFANSQPRCSLSRLDALSCTPNDATIQPGLNEQGIYRTRIVGSQSGFAQCNYRDPNRFPNSQMVQPINDLGNPNLRLIFSPGFLLDEDYANALLVIYNVQCPVGRRAFYNLVQVDLQGADCVGRCTDYIFVNHDRFGVSESCGTEPADNSLQLGDGSFTVTFRTGERTRGRGFELYIICYEPQELDLPGCFRVGENSTVNATGNDASTRRRRDLEEFHNQWRRRLRRGAAGRRFQQLIVQFGDTVTFRDSILTVNRDGEEFARFRNILVLQTFDNQSNLDLYIRESAVIDESTGEKNFIVFAGPGPMIIIDRIAYFQLFAIDPRGILPNPAEMVVLEELTSELFETLPVDSDTLIPDPEPPTEFLPVFPLPGRRRKRQQEDANVSDEAIREAIRNENACNPALLTLSQITLQVANEQNATRVEIIREMLLNSEGV